MSCWTEKYASSYVYMTSIWCSPPSQWHLRGVGPVGSIATSQQECSGGRNPGNSCLHFPQPKVWNMRLDGCLPLDVPLWRAACPRWTLPLSWRLLGETPAPEPPCTRSKETLSGHQETEGPSGWVPEILWADKDKITLQFQRSNCHCSTPAVWPLCPD